MSTVFSSFLRQQLVSTPTLFDNVHIQAVAWRQSPVLDPNNTTISGKQTVAAMRGQNGWVEVTGTGWPVTTNIVLLRRDVGVNHYATFNQFIFTGDGVHTITPTEVRAVTFYMIGTVAGVVNPVIMTTDTPFDGLPILLNAGDAITASTDSNLAGTPNRWLFSWATPGTGVTAVPLIEGPLAWTKSAPPFETSHAQHVWIYPQRANMIANPSFEAPGITPGHPELPDFWASDGALTRVSAAVGGVPEGGAWYGSATGGSPGYLTPNVGTVTTPDPGPLPGECTFIFKTQGPFTRSGYHTVAAQTVSGNASWFLQRRFPSGTLQLGATTAVGTYPQAVSGVTLGATTANDETWAMSLDLDDGAGQMQLVAYQPVGGVWTQVATASAPTMALADASSPVQIGGYDGVNAWTGRIYSVELRTGLDPTKGTVIWRFDANDYPGTGTVYTDPRGRTWTLATASALTPKTGTAPGYAIMESNVFPTDGAERWTIQAKVKGTGILKVGFLYWDADYATTYSDWGTEQWTLYPDAWVHITVLRTGYQTFQGAVRFEVQGTGLSLDEVLVEKDWLTDWPYFDGDSTYGAVGDYSWYGGVSRAGGTYSLWYNNKKAVYGRLFGMDVDDDDVLTDAEVEEWGYVYRWVPAGMTVTPHIDVLYVNDQQAPVPAKTGITPRQVTAGDAGVQNPWV